MKTKELIEQLKVNDPEGNMEVHIALENESLPVEFVCKNNEEKIIGISPLMKKEEICQNCGDEIENNEGVCENCGSPK